MNQRDEAKLLEQLEQWNEADEFSRCIEAIEAIPERERGYLLTVMLSRSYSNLAVLGDHSTHGEDDEVDGNFIRHAIELLESVRAQGEDDPYWNARMGYSCLMAYSSASVSYTHLDVYKRQGMETVPKWVAIVRANRYMLEHSSYLIAYVSHPSSGSREVLEACLLYTSRCV